MAAFAVPSARPARCFARSVAQANPRLNALLYTDRFRRSYQEAPAEVQRAFDRRAGFLMQNLQHPSLRAKKYDEARDIWQARVNADWRFYFQIKADTYILLDIIPHPK